MYHFLGKAPAFFPTYLLSDPRQSSPQYFQPLSLYPYMMQLSVLRQNMIQGPVQQIRQPQQNVIQVIEESNRERAGEENHQNAEEQKVVIAQNSQMSKNKEKKEKVQKPKRPLTYLTERAYYMNQKLRGKMKSNKRELRRRIPPKPSKRSHDQEKNKQEDLKKPGKVEKKKLISKQALFKGKKLTEKSKPKTASAYVESLANLPILYDLENGLTQFISKKKFSLLQRQFC